MRQLDATTIELPDNKFTVQMSLQPDEHDARHCRYIKSKLNGLEPFAFLAYASYALPQSSRARLKAYLQESIQKYSEIGVHGEKLNLGELQIEEHHLPASRDCLLTEHGFILPNYLEDGFVVRCSKYEPVTWPWVEWYLDMRKNLPRKERLSLEFFNPGEENKPSA